MGDHVGKNQPAAVLGRAPAAGGNEPGEAAVGGAVGRQAEQAWRILKVEPCADDKPDAELLCCNMGANDAGKAVAVGEGDGMKA
jgi:hypothetical protein